MFKVKNILLSAGLAMMLSMLPSAAFAGWFDSEKSDSHRDGSDRFKTEHMDKNHMDEKHMDKKHMDKKDIEKEKKHIEKDKEAFAAWDKEEKPTSVKVDIKPDDEMNQLSGKETFEVALLGSEDFDVANVDQGSLTLGEAEGTGNNRIADINNDGVDDLVAEFSGENLQLDQNTDELTLKGETKDGKSFKGSDKVSFAAAEF